MKWKVFETQILLWKSILAFYFMATNDPIQGKTSIFKPTDDYLYL